MTRPISIDIPHQLGVAEAKKRIDTGLGRLEQQIAAGMAQVDKRWDGDQMSFSAKALGQVVTGRLEVLADTVRMEVDLPAFLAMVADKIKGRLKKEGTLLLEKK